MRYFYSLFLVLTFLVASCSQPGRSSDLSSADTLQLKYASLLHIYAYPDYHVVVIDNPWKPGRELHRYLLVPRGKDVVNLPEGTRVQVPVERITSATSVHAHLLMELGALSQISGICDFEYVHDSTIIAAVSSGRMLNLGSALQPNTELIISGKTEAMLVSPFDQCGYGALERTNIPLIECADYMETSPLGRAEWIRFYGLLTGHEQRADSIFRQVESRYLSLCQLAAEADSHPTLMCDAMNGAAWYVPGSESAIGKIYQDAGATYLFADYKESGSVRLSFETVYQKAKDADFWFLKYGAAESYTYQSLRSEKEQYARFRPYGSRRIFACNTLQVPFYEQEPYHPDLLLADIINILHPGLLKNHRNRFFTPLP